MGTNQSLTFKSFLIGTVLFFIGLTIYNCKNPEITSDYLVIEPIAFHKNGKAFAGSESCIPCHTAIYNSHINTAHFKTSALADSSSIKGDFELGKNTFTLNDRVLFNMTASDSGVYQKANFIHNQLELSNLKVDIVIGSGTKGQSYLSWENDELLQLQTSYFTPANRWTSSPGLKELISPRPVIARCFECHSTYAKNISPDKKGNHFDRNQIIYGIDCERCHGPSAKHVGYHKKNPEANVSKYIIKQSELTQQQKLDVCALCHSGGRKPIQPPFSFTTGDDLSKFSASQVKENNTSLDVHGNQYGLLTASKCFTESKNMDCATCHNPHKNQRNQTATFIQKCIECHSKGKTICMANDDLLRMKNNDCVSCHMPLIPSKSMKIQVDTIETAVKVRTHLIAIYPEEVKKHNHRIEQ